MVDDPVSNAQALPAVTSRRREAMRSGVMEADPEDVSRKAATRGVLTAKARHALPEKDFAGPGESYPMHDAPHARNALARASQEHNAGRLSASSYKSITAAVQKRWPGIGKG